MVLPRLIISLLILVLSVFYTGAESCAADTIKIAMITAKTGEAGKTNSISFPAARFAVNEINKSGGVLGRQIELLEYDNLSTKEGSAAAGRQAVADGAVAVVGCNWSSHSLAMAEVLQEAKIPMISHMSTNVAVTLVGDYIFRACFTDPFQGYGLARFSREKLKDKTAVVLVDENREYSKGLAKTFVDAFEKLDGKILWQGAYGEKNIPYDELLQTVRTLSPDALFIPGAYSDVSALVGKAKEMGLSMHMLSADGVGIKMYDYIGKKADDVYFSGHWSRWVDTRESRQFVRRYEEAVGSVNEDTMALVNDCFYLLADALARAGATDGPRLRDSIADTKGFQGVTGVIRFDENGDPVKPMTINKLKFGGVLYLEQVYP